MELILKRRFLGKNYTIGSLYLSPQGRGIASDDNVTTEQGIKENDIMENGSETDLSPNPSADLSPNPFPQGRGIASDDNVTTEQGIKENDIMENYSKENTTTIISSPLWAGGRGEGGRGEEYFCDTLEDIDRGLTQSMPLSEIRRIKIAHETAIPIGEYKIIVNVSPSKKRMLPRLLDVPGFTGILIHRGNTKNDSSGCILVGENKIKGKVINSTQYEKRLVEILTEVQNRNEEIRIKVRYEGNDKL